MARLHSYIQCRINCFNELLFTDDTAMEVHALEDILAFVPV